MNKWCRRRYAVLFALDGSKGIVVDMYKKRLELMRSRIFSWARIMTEVCKNPGLRKVMIGMTYKNADDYKPGHFHQYLKKIKQMLGENLIGFAWVAELQMRGAIHYHLMLAVKKGTRIPKPDESGMWPWGSSNICTARSYFYICSYLGKEYQKDLDKYPKSARMYGASMRGNLDLQKVFREFSGLDRSKIPADQKWRFVGATVTKGYTEVLLQTERTKAG